MIFNGKIGLKQVKDKITFPQFAQSSIRFKERSGDDVKNLRDRPSLKINHGADFECLLKEREK